MQSRGRESALLFVGGSGALEAVARALGAAGGARARTVATVAAAVAALDRQAISAVVVSNGLAPGALATLHASCRRRHPEIPVVVLGASASVEEAIDAMRGGAADFLPPPVDPDVLALRLERLLQRNIAGEGGAPSRPGAAAELPGLIGDSAPMQRLYDTIARVSRYRTSVLLLGESGTGKELVARALHGRGPRRQHLFVPVNCATLGRELLENELFGHERGAYTGATERKKGLFELADGGTLFLDEIGEMDPSTQAKLLRVLERNEFRRVGGTEKVKVDLSLIAATHRNLTDLIAAGKFREDLYYRLKVVTLLVPPLRDRKEDIPALIDHFIADFNRRNAQKIRGVSPPLLRRFMSYSWPGNVRELKNAVESAAILAVDQMLEVDPLEAAAGAVPAPARGAAPDGDGDGDVDGDGQGGDHVRIPLSCTLAEAEERIVAAHVARGGTKMEIARRLGMGVRTLYTKLSAWEQSRRRGRARA